MKNYDPTSLGPREREATAVVVCVRDPDESNSYIAWGREFANGLVMVYDIDLGRSDLSDIDEYAAWANTHTAQASHLAALGWVDAANYIEDLVARHDPFKEG